MRLSALLITLALPLAACLPAVPPPTGGPAPASPKLTVAVAANFRAAAEEIAALFEQETSVHAGTVVGASGSLASQIIQGAPFDVFLSADMELPRQLEASGHAAAGSLQPYAIGRLVLWTPHSAPPELDDAGGLRLLLAPEVKRIAIANPATAPYGAATVDMLTYYGYYQKVQAKLVTADSVAQAAQFVQSGAADVAFLALSQVREPPLRGTGRIWQPSPTTHRSLEQGAVALTASRWPSQAAEFLRFLQGSKAVEILKLHGYGTP